MVSDREFHSNYVRCLPNANIIGELMRKGGTIYRKSDDGSVLIVPSGASHCDAWNLIMGR